MTHSFSQTLQAAFVLSALVLAGCGGGGGGSSIDSADASKSATAQSPSVATDATSAQKPKLPTEPAVLAGEFLFKDVNLSASRQMACVTCHSENSGHADKGGTRLPLGGPLLDVAGMRSSPTGRYLNENPAFSIDNQGVPRGGFTWDGRADSRKEQAAAPFFEHQEMALPGSPSEPSAVTARVRAAAYYPSIQALFRPNELDTDAKLFDKITTLLELYQRDDADYNLFDSRYDQWLENKTTLTAAELRGLQIFSDANKGNCLSCHGTAAGKGANSATGNKAPKQLFTNFGYAALAAPRNHEGPKNADPAYYDLGLCTRERSTHEIKKRAASNARYCGMFKTPTLRNIERTAPYFHNASVPTLEAAVRFHFERDTQPAKYYRRADGSPDRTYNDLPASYLPNIVRGKPFDGSYSPTDLEIGDLIAFLKTLTDADQTGVPD